MSTARDQAVAHLQRILDDLRRRDAARSGPDRSRREDPATAEAQSYLVSVIALLTPPDAPCDPQPFSPSMDLDSSSHSDTPPSSH